MFAVIRGVNARDHAGYWMGCRLTAFALLVLTTPGASPSRQGAPPFEVLSVPAQNFGTCVPLRGVDSTARTSHLVVKSLPPGGTREITVMADASGHTFTYSDRVVVMRSPAAGVGKSVIAFGEQGGAVNGFLQELETSYPAIPLDAAGLRALRDSAKSNMSQRSLTGSEQRRVSEVIVFLRKRCPV